MRRIGGTDISKLVGLNPYGGPIDVYSRIVEGTNLEQNKAMRRGLLLEPVARQMYLDETGAVLKTPAPGFFESTRYPFMSASLDDVATRDGQELVVEYKTANIRMLDKWGDAGSDQVPAEYLVQCAWYMSAVDLPIADLGVLIAGDEFRVYRITRDLELESMLLEAAERFWTDHVIPKRPPPPDASSNYSEWLAKRYPEDRAPLLPADSAAAEWAAKLEVARRERADAEEREQLARNALIASIGEAAGIEGENFRITYKQTKGRESVDWDAVCSELKVPPSVIAKHTKRTAYRVFRPQFGGK
jgi:putative phage-type endonuclease